MKSTTSRSRLVNRFFLLSGIHPHIFKLWNSSSLYYHKSNLLFPFVSPLLPICPFSLTSSSILFKILFLCFLYLSQSTVLSSRTLSYRLSLIVSLSILNIIIYIILFPIQSPIYIISLSVFYLIRSSPVFKSPFLNPIHSVSSRSNPSFSVPVSVTFHIFSLSYTLKYIILYPHHHLSFPLSFLFSTYHKSYKISPKYSIYSSSFSYIH